MEKIIKADEVESEKVRIFNSEKFGRVRTILNDDASISISAEDTAIGFGWYKIKGNMKYPRWSALNSYIHDFGFSQDVGKDDYIPESLFYLLGMKANNNAAVKFQKWLAIYVLPELRKNGFYNIDKFSKEIRAILLIDERTVEMADRLESLEDNMTIDYNQQRKLRSLATKKVVAVLGGKDAPAYRELNKKAFSSMWNDYKKKLNVNSSYKDTLVKDLEEARHIIIEWKPERDLELMIKGANAGFC